MCRPCCRGGDGELRLGIRRAAEVKIGAAVLPPNGQQFNASNIAVVVNAISMRSSFDICYNPRYIISLQKCPLETLNLCIKTGDAGLGKLYMLVMFIFFQLMPLNL